MKRLLKIYFIAIICIIAILFLAENRRLKYEYHTQTTICQGGDPADPATWLACNQRDNITETLTARGFCYGKEDQAEYQKEWYLCKFWLTFR